MSDYPIDIRWDDDPIFWASLDDFVHLCWTPLKELLDVLYEHRDELAPHGQALLFGGLGKFIQIYHHSRAHGFDEVESFNEAVRAVQADTRVQSMVESAANQTVDLTVERMKEGAE